MLTIIVSLVTFAGGGTFDIPEIETRTCREPRYFYEHYKFEPTSSEDISFFRRPMFLSDLSCERSRGVLSNESCSNINGCSWETPELNLFKRILNWIPGILFEDPEPSCFGVINATSYEIEQDVSDVRGMLIIGEDYIKNEDEDSNVKHMSPCEHSKVVNNETLCGLFSCTWFDDNNIDEIILTETLDFSGSRGMVSTVWSTVRDLALFRFDFGVENNFVTHILTFFIFWLPLVGMILSIIMIIRG